MSYILDALRRADAERERGAVPSLHTQQYGAMPGDEDDAPRRSRLPTVLAGVLAAALVAVVGWHYLGAATAPAPVATVALPVPASPVVAPVPAPTVGTAPTFASSPASPSAPSPASPPASPAALALAPATRNASTKPPPTKAVPAEMRAAPLRAPAASGAATDERVYAMSELPDDVRRDLPKLAFGGASYSADAGSRMVILNGQVFHEGDSVARGVVVQRVNRKSAILAVRGYRFELVF